MSDPGPLRTVRLLRARAGQLEAKVARLESEGEALEKILAAKDEQMSAMRQQISSLKAIVAKMTDDYNSLVDDYDRQQDVTDELVDVVYAQAALLNKIPLRDTQVLRIIESEGVATMAMTTLEKFKKLRDGCIEN